MNLLNTLCDKMIASAAHNSKIKSIYLGGSHAREHFDNSSDFDFCILWSQIPDYLERIDFYKQIGMEKIIKVDEDPSEDGNIADHFIFSGTKVDINSLLYENILLFAKGLNSLDYLTPDIQELAYALKTGKPLFGEDALNKIKSHIEKPTDNQRYLNLQKIFQKNWISDLNISLKRNDWPSYFNILNAVYLQIFQASCLCEKKYYPGPKRHQNYQKNFKNNWMKHMNDIWHMQPQIQIIAVENTLFELKKFLEQGMV